MHTLACTHAKTNSSLSQALTLVHKYRHKCVWGTDIYTALRDMQACLRVHVYYEHVYARRTHTWVSWGPLLGPQR